MIGLRAISVLLFFAGNRATPPDVQAIVRSSLAATRKDWNAAPNYSFHETDFENGRSKTYAVTMILGSPYRSLIAVDNVPVSPAKQAEEQRKMKEATAQRQAESPEERTRRTSQYEKERKRDDLMMSQMIDAFEFTLAGEARLRGNDVYVLKAMPKPGYHPVNFETEALPGMRGRMWIDKTTFQWVRVEAQVMRPVQIAGFLARVEPGTHFELDKSPVSEGVWLPSRYVMRSQARILDIFPHRGRVDEQYSDYQRIEDTSLSANP